MTGRQLFSEAWNFRPSVISGCIVLFLAYLWMVQFSMNKKTTFFAWGVVLMLLTLVGPLDFFGDKYLFSAHMLEHILLELAVPPLLLLGLPEDTVRSLLSVSVAAKVEQFLRKPAIAWLLAVGTLWLWHLPMLYNAALNSEGIHAVQHLSMLITGTIFWWPIFAPLRSHRLSPIGGAIYIFIAISANMILGILLTFSPLGYYPKYMRSTDSAGIFPFIRTVWQLDAQSDLYLGGLFMWIVAGLMYFAVLLAVVSRLYRNPEAQVMAEKGVEDGKQQ